MKIRLIFVSSSSSVLLALWTCAISAIAAPYPTPTQGSYTIRNFHFNSGETLPAVKIHYISFGAPARDSQGIVTNAILILHGTGGTCSNFIRPDFAGELFGAGQLLDAARYYS